MDGSLSPYLGRKLHGSTQDRRHHRRFPIATSTHYELTGIQGQALTGDISSGGVLLKSDRILPLEEHIEVSIDWPVSFDAQSWVRLVVLGKTIRSDASGTAVRIIRYAFKTGPRVSF